MCTFRDGDAFAIGAYCLGFSINLKIAVRLIVIWCGEKMRSDHTEFSTPTENDAKFFWLPRNDLEWVSWESDENEAKQPIIDKV